MRFKIFDVIFGETIDYGHGRIFLPVLFCIVLSSTTLLFFNHKTILIFGYPLHLSMGLIVFPLTFTLTNIMQELYGKLFANTAVRYGFLCDALLVFIAFVLSNLGERQDYFTVYKDPPTIMVMTFIFLWMSTLINTIMFEKLKNWGKSTFARFFISSVLAETSISIISIPTMMWKNNLTDGAFLSVLFIVLYKVISTFILSVIISVKMHWNNHHQ